VLSGRRVLSLGARPRFRVRVESVRPVESVRVVSERPGLDGTGGCAASGAAPIVSAAARAATEI